jgi:non-homologous end joining protein Ku
VDLMALLRESVNSQAKPAAKKAPAKKVANHEPARKTRARA